MLSKLLSSDSMLVLKAIPSPQLSWLKISILILRLDWCGFGDLIPHDSYLGVYNTEMSKPQWDPSAGMSYLKGTPAYLPLSSSFLLPSVSFLLLSEPSAAFCAQVLLLNHFCPTFWFCWKQNTETKLKRELKVFPIYWKQNPTISKIMLIKLLQIYSYIIAALGRGRIFVLNFKKLDQNISNHGTYFKIVFIREPPLWSKVQNNALIFLMHWNWCPSTFISFSISARP